MAAPTGGTITTVGAYTYHTFTAGGTLTHNGDDKTLDVLVVGGGGGSSSFAFGGSGGGGAGEVKALTAQSFTANASVTVGAGGDAGTNQTSAGDPDHTAGSDSAFGATTAVGGGRGGWSDWAGGSNTDAATDGSGGGACGEANASSGGGTTSSDNANAGGANGNAAGSSDRTGGGGGGASTVGVDGVSATSGGDGGDGYTWLDSNVYGGGGGGGVTDPDVPGDGGTGGGGDGGASAGGRTNTAGTANSGGGAGGIRSGLGMVGGSGIVIVRYLTATTPVLSLTSKTADTINLEWTAVDGSPTGYDVERDGTIIVSDHSGQTYSDTGLDPATEYDHRVRAVWGFKPSQIDWHSMFWAEGDEFKALGLADAASVTTWPNETGESDATEATNPPTFDAAHASFNGQPVLAFDGTEWLTTATFTSAPTYPISVVAIAKATALSATQTVCDGLLGTDEGRLSINTTPDWVIDCGTPVTVGTGDTDTHLWVAYMNDSGDDTLDIDGSQVISGAAGNETIIGMTIGSIYNNSFPWDGEIAFLAVFSGDVTADPAWPAFKSWVTAHYSITVA